MLFNISAKFIIRRWIHIRRPPVVTIMGHVDHGKTTLLDNLRHSQIVKQEFGGITQHIGAFVVPFKSDLVTFLDTPGHAAFASMRKRGANVTDIVILVIACEDGILDQTIESIKYAKESGVPMIVAVNKIDKFKDKTELDKAIKRIRQELLVNDIITEEDGGDVQLVPISALKGIGVDDLKENIMALAETLELKADPDAPIQARVIESSVDRSRGKIATILIQNGTVRKGSYLIAGHRNWARVRALFDEKNQLKQSCSPGLPIQVTGWRESALPAPGDIVEETQTESEAKQIVREYYDEEAKLKAIYDSEVAEKKEEKHKQLYEEKLAVKRASSYKGGRIFFNERGRRPKEFEIDEFEDRKVNIILKCDVDGSMEALLELLDSYDPKNNQLVKMDVMHFGVGDITENDLQLASSFPNSVIYGFNVKAQSQNIMLKAKQEKVQIRLYNVIYHLIDDLKDRLANRLPELEKEIQLGQANVLDEFLVKEKGRKGKLRVAGCKCSQGTMKKDLLYKVMRHNEIIASELEVYTLKHFKEDVKEITKGFECGISFTNDLEIEFKPGDIILAYERQKYKPTLKWNLRGFG